MVFRGWPGHGMSMQVAIVGWLVGWLGVSRDVERKYLMICTYIYTITQTLPFAFLHSTFFNLTSTFILFFLLQDITTFLSVNWLRFSVQMQFVEWVHLHSNAISYHLRGNFVRNVFKLQTSNLFNPDEFSKLGFQLL